MRVWITLGCLIGLVSTAEGQNCKKGIPCGRTCIAANRICRIGSSTASPARAAEPAAEPNATPRGLLGTEANGTPGRPALTGLTGADGNVGFCTTAAGSERILQIPVGQAPTARIGMDVMTASPVAGPTSTPFTATLISLFCRTANSAQALVDLNGRRVLLDPLAVPLRSARANQVWSAWLYVVGSGGVAEAEVWRDELGVATLRAKPRSQ